MTTLREAAQQALEALESWKDEAPSQWTTRDEKTITAIRAVLAQEKQEEPYAWMAIGGTIWRHKTSDDDVPLYTHPPRREWQSLSEKEFWSLPEARGWFPGEHYRLTKLARAVEAKLKEKNNG